MTTTKEPKIGTLQTDSDGSRIYVGENVNGDGWLWLHRDTARRLSALLQRPPWRPMSECPVPSERWPVAVKLEDGRTLSANAYLGGARPRYLDTWSGRTFFADHCTGWYPLPEVTK